MASLSEKSSKCISIKAEKLSLSEVPPSITKCDFSSGRESDLNIVSTAFI